MLPASTVVVGGSMVTVLACRALHSAHCRERRARSSLHFALLHSTAVIRSVSRHR